MMAEKGITMGDNNEETFEDEIAEALGAEDVNEEEDDNNSDDNQDDDSQDNDDSDDDSQDDDQDDSDDDSKDSDDDSDDADEEDDEVTKLRAELNKRYGETDGVHAEGEEEDADKDKPAEKLPSELKLETVDFLDGVDDMDEFMTDKSKVNELLNKVFQQGATAGAEFGAQKGAELALKNIPNMVKNVAENQAGAKERIDQFYEENSELSDYRNVVKKVAGKIKTDNPNLTNDQLLKLTADEARKVLQLKKSATEDKGKGKGKGKKPGFSSHAGSRPSKKGKLTGEQGEIAEMLKHTDPQR